MKPFPIDEELAVPHSQHNRSQQISASMYLVAGVVFLLTALLGDTGASSAFFILAAVFVVLALNAWQSSRT